MPRTDALYISFDRLAYDVPLIDPKVEAEWNDWYDNTHLARVSAVVGAHTATRWKVYPPGVAQYIAVYELEGTDGVRGLTRLHNEVAKWWAAGKMHPRHKTIQNALVKTIAEYDPATGHLYRQRPQPGASQRTNPRTKAIHLIFSSSNDPAGEETWNDWYMYHHSPMAIQTGAFVRATRFERSLPEPIGGNMEPFYTHMTIYDIERDDSMPPIDWPGIEKVWDAKGLMNPNHTGAPGYNAKAFGKWAGVGFHP